jgi:SulP family sulfate permease
LIAGSAGVIALPMAKLVATAGMPFMTAAVLLSSALQLLFGGLKLSSLLDVVTEPVICGFLNALGIFLLQTQVKIFKASSGAWLGQASMMPSLLTAAVCFAITKLMPMVKKDSVVPPSLVGLLTASTLAHALGWTGRIKTLADTVGKAQFAGGLAALPVFTGLPKVPLSTATLGVIASTAVSLRAGPRALSRSVCVQ